MSDFVVTLNSNKKEISILNGSKLKMDGKEFKYEISLLSGNTYLLKIDNTIYELTYNKIDSEKHSVLINGNEFETVVRTSLQEKASKLIEKSLSAHHKMEVKAPMPGMILKIRKKVGDEVSQGESVIILEAMKMENDLHSPVSGKIKEILVAEGTAVEKGANLFSIE